MSLASTHTERPLVRALRAAVLALPVLACLPAVSAHAAEPASAQPAAAARAYDIPAGPLGPALSRLALEAGIALSYDAALVDGRQTAGVSGDMTLPQAATRLLTGSGLALQRRADGSYTLRADAGASVAALAPVLVTGSVDPGLTEHTGAYTTRAVSTAMRLPLSLRETPQTMAVVTRQQMDDFSMSDVNDVLESSSGVSVVSQGENGTMYYSRGFEMQTQYDGLANPVGIGNSNLNPSPDSAFLDHVEILQGASGLLSGAGEPGGTVNMVRKRPTRAFQAQAETLFGSWDRKRFVGDVSGAIAPSGAVRARAVVLWDDRGSFMDYGQSNKRGFFGVVDADLGEGTTASVSLQYQRNRATDHLGVPMAPDGGDLGLSRSAYYGSAHASTTKEYTLYTASLEQRLPSDWVAKGVFQYNRTKVDARNGSYLWGKLDPVSGDGLNLYQSRYLDREFDSKSVDLYASGPVQLLGRRHELVVGANGQQLRGATYNSAGIPTAINVYNFTPASLTAPDGVREPLPTADRARQYGAFGVLRMNLTDRLKVIAGSRVSWYTYDDESGARQQEERAVVSPYAGIIYDLDARHSVYASYSDIFKPQTNRDSGGSTIDPVVGRNYEVGVKGEFREGRLNAGAALFRLEQVNLPRTDEAFGYDPGNICGGWCSLAQDKVVSQGLDLNLGGELAPGWQVGAGYTWVLSQYASGEQKGDAYRTKVPKHALRLYTTYRLPDTGWTLGGTLRVQNRIHEDGSSGGVASRVRQGGLALVGLMAKYEINERAEVSLAVDNLFDRKYFASVGSVHYETLYGEPRKVSLGLKYRY